MPAVCLFWVSHFLLFTPAFELAETKKPNTDTHSLHLWGPRESCVSGQPGSWHLRELLLVTASRSLCRQSNRGPVGADRCRLVIPFDPRTLPASASLWHPTAAGLVHRGLSLK